jgi:hypothetical protein
VTRIPSIFAVLNDPTVRDLPLFRAIRDEPVDVGTAGAFGRYLERIEDEPILEPRNRHERRAAAAIARRRS